jgi:hypothetical protein
MTPEERFQKIEENLLVTSEMMRTSERRWEERFEVLGSGISEHEARMTRLERVLEHLADDQATTRAMLQSLIETVDRFLRGQGGNGQER